jgi:hypothetical protein
MYLLSWLLSAAILYLQAIRKDWLYYCLRRQAVVPLAAQISLLELSLFTAV